MQHTPSPDVPSSRRRRAALAVAAGAVLVTGLAVRLLFSGAWTGPVGDALYAVLVYLLISFALPRRSPLTVGILAVAVCVGVELFQLTGLPAAWAQALPPTRLLLGTTFTPGDLPLYALGGAAAAALDAAAGRAGRSARRRPTAQAGRSEHSASGL